MTKTKHQKAMDYIYDRKGCPLTEGGAPISLKCAKQQCSHTEECITSDTEVDDEEVRCGKCGRTVCLYSEEIYHEYQLDEMNYLCRQCVDTGHMRERR